MLPGNGVKKVVGEFLIFASSKSYGYFRKGNACFINNSQSLLHVKSKPDKQSKFTDIFSLSPAQIRAETNSICEALYFWKSNAIFRKHYNLVAGFLLNA